MQYQIIEWFSLMVVIKYIKNESRVKEYYDASSIVWLNQSLIDIILIERTASHPDLFLLHE